MPIARIARCFRALALCAAELSALGAVARPIEVLRDVNHTIGFPFYTPQPPVAFGSSQLVTLCSPAAGCEPWITDFTQDGTRQLKDIRPGKEGSFARQYTAVGGTAFFLAYSGFGQDLWKTDGTAQGTVQLTTGGNAQDAAMASLGAVVFFVSSGELWKSDGSVEGTVMVTDLAGASNPVIGGLTTSGDAVYFSGTDPVNGRALWKSDGTAAGTVRVRNIALSTPSANLEDITALGSTVLFVANGPGGTQWWASDGTEAGTVPLASVPYRDLNSNDYKRSKTIVLGGVAYFVAPGTDGDSTDLWRTDGTPGGTGIVHSVPRPWHFSFARSGAYLYFETWHPSEHSALWRTDGTAAGFVKVATADSLFFGFAPAGDTLFFGNSPGNEVMQLWKSDGSEAGTGPVATFTVDYGTGITPLGGFGGSAMFALMDDAWISDGTDAGTRKMLVAPSEPSGPSSCGHVHSRAVLNGEVYFAADDGVHGCELWKSNGTPAGTVLVKDVRPGRNGGVPTRLTTAGNAVFFVADDGVHGEELWKTDGTEAGTLMVTDLDPGSSGAFFGRLHALGSTVLFRAWDGSAAGLWKSDGTAAGTVLVQAIDIFDSAPEDAEEIRFAVVGTTAFFLRGFPAALWKTDGTPAGTVFLKQLGNVEGGYYYLTAAQAQLFFVNANEAGYGLWRSDGTEAGTRLAKDIAPGGLASVFGPLAPLGNAVVFGGSNGTSTGLWRSDGTAAGTFLLRDALLPLLRHSLANTDGRIYFRGLEGMSPVAMYVTDGTAAGTSFSGQMPFYTDQGSPILPVRGSNFFLEDNVHEGLALWLAGSSFQGGERVDIFNPSDADHVPPGNVEITALPTGLFLFGNNAGVGWEPSFMAFDTQPNPITIAPKLGVATSSTVVSEAVRVTGTNVDTPVSVTGGLFCPATPITPCQCTAPFSAAGSLNALQFFCVRHTAASTLNTTTTTTLNIGGVIATFSSVTDGPRLAFAAPAYTVNEGGASVSVQVARSGTGTGAVGVTWTTENGTAAAGTDFGVAGNAAQLTGTLTWAAGDSAPKSITLGTTGSVPIINDNAIEPAKTFGLRLSAPSGGALVGEQSATLVTINDPDNTLQFESSVASVGEVGSNVTLLVSRNGSTAAPASVTWTTANGTAVAGGDFGITGSTAQRTGTLTWPAGDGSSKAIVVGPAPGANVAVINDLLIEGPETFTITLSSPGGGATLGAVPVATITIVSDDRGVTMGAASVSVVESAGTVNVQVQRAGPSSGAVSVDYATVNGTATAGAHYTATSGTLTWPDGDAAPRNIAVPILDNNVVNATRTFTVRLANASGATLGTPATTSVAITDDDNTVQFTLPAVSVGEATPTLALAVSRTGIATAPASVTWTTANASATAGSDFGIAGNAAPLSGTLSWGANDSSGRTITIPILNDTLVEGPETFNVTLSSPSGTVLGANATVVVTITENDAGFAFAAAAYSVAEAGSNVTLTVNRHGPVTAAASVKWATSNGTATAGQDFGLLGSAAPRTGTLSWAAGDSTSKTLVIPILNDTANEGDETFVVTLSMPSTGSALGTPASATVTILDDDIPPESTFAFGQPKYLVAENGGSALLFVTRAALPGGSLDRAASVGYATAAGSALATSDFASRNGTLAWATGEGGAKSIEVPIVNDSVPEALESFRVALSAATPGASIATPEATVVIVDDDEAFPPGGAIPAGWAVSAGAAAGWHVSNDPGAYEGVYALRSDAVGDGESAGVEVTGTFVAGNVAFRARVSSEAGFDALHFYVDGVVAGEWSGLPGSGWLFFSTPVAAGTHTFRWAYEKDGSASVGADAAWIDAVTLPPAP